MRNGEQSILFLVRIFLSILAKLFYEYVDIIIIE